MSKVINPSQTQCIQPFISQRNLSQEYNRGALYSRIPSNTSRSISPWKTVHRLNRVPHNQRPPRDCGQASFVLYKKKINQTTERRLHRVVLPLYASPTLNNIFPGPGTLLYCLSSSSSPSGPASHCGRRGHCVALVIAHGCSFLVFSSHFKYTFRTTYTTRSTQGNHHGGSASLRSWVVRGSAPRPAAWVGRWHK